MDRIIFTPDAMLDVMDLRSAGFFFRPVNFLSCKLTFNKGIDYDKSVKI